MPHPSRGRWPARHGDGCRSERRSGGREIAERDPPTTPPRRRRSAPTRRSRVDAGKVRDRAERAVFHGHAFATGQEVRASARGARGIRRRSPRAPLGVAAAGLDSMNEQQRLAFTRHEIRPAAGEQVPGEVESGERGRILAAEVPQQPCIEARARRDILNLADWQRGASGVHDSREVLATRVTASRSGRCRGRRTRDRACVSGVSRGPPHPFDPATNSV